MIKADLTSIHVPENTSLRSKLVLSILTYIFNIGILASLYHLGDLMLHLVNETPHQMSAKVKLFVHLFLFATAASGSAASTGVLRGNLMQGCRKCGASIRDTRVTLRI
jgi:hypothetical protein